MVLNATFNNISVISWRSVLLVKETGEPGENHRPVVSHWQILSHNALHLALIEVRTRNISGDSRRESNYHTITLYLIVIFFFIVVPLWPDGSGKALWWNKNKTKDKQTPPPQKKNKKKKENENSVY